MPSIDLDFLLIAIRIATYGDKMEVNANCPHCSAENSYDMDLNLWFQKFAHFNYNEEIDVDPLRIFVRPYSYLEITKTSIKTIEQQRIFNIINDEKMSDEEKVDRFGKSFVKITQLTVDVIAECISRIVAPEGEVTDKDQIKEFINNCSKDIFDKISNHISQIREELELKAVNVSCQDCKEVFDVPITMDQANFFAVRS
jgi:hypothetical protein